jgi:segregation and condensation protein B
MAKKEKKASPAKPAPAPAPKKAPRPKKQADTPLLNGSDVPEDPAGTETDAPVAEAPPEPAPKSRGKKKKGAAASAAANDEATAAPDESSSERHGGDTTTALPAVEDSDAPAPKDEAAVDEPKTPVDFDQLERLVEALLFAAEEPLQVRELARCAGSDSPTIRKVLPRIKQRFDAERRAWDVVEVANGWRLVTRPEFYPAIQKLKTQTLQRKLTQAALETLALIAYRQPLSRAEIESVRGVGAGPVLRQLLERKLVRIAGRGTGLGQPLLYGTTDYFLEHFGLSNLQELPKPGEFKQ